LDVPVAVAAGVDVPLGPLSRTRESRIGDPVPAALTSTSHCTIVFMSATVSCGKSCKLLSSGALRGENGVEQESAVVGDLIAMGVSKFLNHTVGFVAEDA
jgi:hypothetical protein